MVTSDGNRLHWLGGLFLAALFCLRPVDQPDLWWHLARGRAVVAGTSTPASQLLTLDRAAEADWLGGLPFYLLWTQTGVGGLACFPLVAGLALLAVFLRRLPPDARGSPAILMSPLFLWAVRDGLQPVPGVFDLFGLIAVWTLLQPNQHSGNGWLNIGAVFCLWANLSPLPMWGLLLISLYAKEPGKLLTAAIVGGALTPRGLLTWRDSFVLFAPRVFCGPGDELDARWPGLLSDGFNNLSTVAFLGLWIGWAVLRMQGQRDFITMAKLALPLLAAVICRDHLPLCALWVALDLLQSPLSLPRLQPGWLVTGGLLLASVMVGDAFGSGARSQSRLGWGIAHQIDPRLLDLAMLAVDEKHSGGWSADARSVGIVSWIGGGVRMVDHPQRALLGGRWSQHADLVRDLRGAHRAGYRRDDGTWGGIVPRLEAWNVQLLFLPVEDVSLNGSLTETPWRPVDLDSPTVAYVSTDDAFFARQVLEVMQQEGYVEAGDWRPSLDVYDGRGWRVDLIGWLGGGPDPAPAIRQSQLFRARDLPLAALRALLPVRQQTSHFRLHEEFRLCQRQLAFQEWVTFGDASLFRKRVVQALGGSQVAMPWLQSSSESAELAPESEPPGLRDYLTGHLREAATSRSGRTDEDRYAAAMIWLELGETSRAAAELRSLPADAARYLVIAAEYWLTRMESFPKPSAAP